MRIPIPFRSYWPCLIAFDLLPTVLIALSLTWTGPIPRNVRLAGIALIQFSALFLSFYTLRMAHAESATLRQPFRPFLVNGLLLAVVLPFGVQTAIVAILALIYGFSGFANFLSLLATEHIILFAAYALLAFFMFLQRSFSDRTDPG